MLVGTYAIYIETPTGTQLGNAITGIRPWMDRHNIEPVEFKSDIKDGLITLDIRFRSRDEARLFEADFALL